MKVFNIITTSCWHTPLEMLLTGEITDYQLGKEWAIYEDLPEFKRKGDDDAMSRPISEFVDWLRKKGYKVSQLEYIDVFV